MTVNYSKQQAGQRISQLNSYLLGEEASSVGAMDTIGTH